MADFFADNFRVENAEFIADFKWEGNVLNDVKIGLPGIHNMENSLVAFAVGIQKGINPTLLKDALLNYGGVDRRFDLHIKSDRIVYIDDYAHHPEEINAVYQAVREMYPEKKILAIFQPHLFSRTKDFGDDFAKSLSQFDEVMLLDIYPARELPMEGITSEWLLKKIKNPNKSAQIGEVAARGAAKTTPPRCIA